MNNSSSKILMILNLIVIILSIFTDFFLEILFATLIANLIYFMFYKQYHPPTILLGLLYSWISIVIGHFYCAFSGDDFRVLLWRPFYSLENINKAFWYSLTGLFILALGLRLSIGKIIHKKINLDELYNINILKILIAFVFYIPITDFLFSYLRDKIPGVSQFFYILKLFRWSIFFLLVVTVFYRKKFIGLFWGVFIYGILTSLASYFSNFKDFFFYFPISYLSIKKLNIKQTIFILFFILFIFILGAYWSYIKMDYRSFLSGGRNAQIVVVNKKDAIKKFFSYINYFDKKRFQLGEQALIKRLFYLEYFSATIRFIPEYKPYMKGENTIRALKHIFMPRIFFPNKPSLDDSKHTMELTGIYVASAKQGTSISTGYMAEFYADFGPVWMYIPIFIIGFLWGKIYRFILSSFNYSIWGFAATIPMFLFFRSYGKDLTKLLGDTIWFLLTFIIIRYTIAKLLIKFFRIKQNSL